MHLEARAGFAKMLAKSGLDPQERWKVLDVGGQDVNGTVHDLLPNSAITTLDIENADIIADATTWQPTQLFDIVIATEVFEHVLNWYGILLTMHKALDPDGPGVLLATCASTNRQPHGATGASAPAEGEHYRNVDPVALSQTLETVGFGIREVDYLYPPGDAYCWAQVVAPLDITVVIPTIRGREKMLARARQSVADQIYRPVQVIVIEDVGKAGAARNRQQGLDQVATEWVAFLDDDDEMLPGHLLALVRAQQIHGADIVWPWFDVQGGTDPFPMHEGRQWDPTNPHQIPITVLARTEAVRAVGGFHDMPEGSLDPRGQRAGEDWDLWLRMSAAGYRFHHVNERTWIWNHHGGNTSGLAR